MPNGKTGPKGPPAKPATSGDVAAQLPQRKARSAPFVAIEALPEGEKVDGLLRYRSEMLNHPETAAKVRLEGLLQTAHLDPLVCASPELSRLVWLWRELLAEAQPGETVEEILEPLRTLLSRHGGGRPPSAHTWEEWQRRVAATRRARPSLTAQEVYEDVAAEWAAEGRAPVTWRGIRNGITKLKSLSK